MIAEANECVRHTYTHTQALASTVVQYEALSWGMSRDAAGETGEVENLPIFGRVKSKQ